MRDIGFANKLQILPSNKVLVPGCEPTSTVTSTRMAAEMREANVCNGALADLDAVLEAIPGASVVLLENFGGPTHKLLQLPELSLTCPCTEYEDYYAIIRSVAGEITEDDIDDILDSGGFCGLSATNCRGDINDQCFCRGIL
jgi:hypothetical protein